MEQATQILHGRECRLPDPYSLTVTEVENQLLFDEGIAAKGRSLLEQMINVDLKTSIFSVSIGQRLPKPIR